jgi:hypothetical protein
MTKKARLRALELRLHNLVLDVEELQRQQKETVPNTTENNDEEESLIEKYTEFLGTIKPRKERLG